MKFRVTNAFLDVLFDVLFWLLRIKDDNPDTPISPFSAEVNSSSARGHHESIAVPRRNLIIQTGSARCSRTEHQP